MLLASKPSSSITLHTSTNFTGDQAFISSAPTQRQRARSPAIAAVAAGCIEITVYLWWFFKGITNPGKTQWWGCVRSPRGPSSRPLSASGTVLTRRSRRRTQGTPWTPRLGIQLGGFDPDPPCAPPPRRGPSGVGPEEPRTPGVCQRALASTVPHIHFLS